MGFKEYEYDYFLSMNEIEFHLAKIILNVIYKEILIL